MGGQQMEWNSSMKRSVSEAEGSASSKELCLPPCLEPQKKKPCTLAIISGHVFVSQAS